MEGGPTGPATGSSARDDSMPKMKTKKSIIGRMRLSKTGKVLRTKSSRGHMRVTKSAKTRRAKRQSAVVLGAIGFRYRTLLGG